MPRAALAPTRRTTPKRTPTPARRPVLKIVPGRKPAAPVSTPVTYGKNDLLKRFAPLVRHVVERVAATLPRNVDHEDLYSAGVLGLLDAHEKFDTGKGVKFETYAVWRIKGAVLDQLRALDWASRSMRRKARNLDGVTRKLDQKLGRAASEDEVARELKMSRDDFYRLLDHVAHERREALEQVVLRVRDGRRRRRGRRRGATAHERQARRGGLGLRGGGGSGHWDSLGLRPEAVEGWTATSGRSPDEAWATDAPPGRGTPPRPETGETR